MENYPFNHKHFYCICCWGVFAGTQHTHTWMNCQIRTAIAINRVTKYERPLKINKCHIKKEIQQVHPGISLLPYRNHCHSLNPIDPFHTFQWKLLAGFKIYSTLVCDL